VDEHCTLAGVKGYEISQINPKTQEVIEAYHQLFAIEKVFRMATSDLKVGRFIITNANQLRRM